MNKIIGNPLTTFLLNLLACFVIVNEASAQCATTSVPAITSGCSVEWFVSISASGAGVASTISLTGGGCTGTGAASYYFNDFATQGVTVPAGNTVNLAITRYTTVYTGYITVYIDWNNDGTYETTELAGTMATLSPTTLTTIYTFTVPTTGIVIGTNLHMRVFLSEIATGAPCTGNYGQVYDYYLNASCPVGAIAITPSPDTICSGGSGILTASGSGSSYTWSPSTGLSATTGASVIASPGATTTYSVIGTSGIGCSYTNAVTVNVVPGGGPADTIFASGSTRFCPGDSVWLHGLLGVGYTYQWYNGAAIISGATDSVYRATTSGNYALQITIPSGCSSVSSPIAVTVFNPVPVVTFVAGILRTGSYYASYQWYENGTAISGATHDSVIAHSNGNYTVKVTDTNGCTGTSAVYAITHLGVTNISNATGINVYPNPATKMICVESPEKVSALITSCDGKKMAEQNDVGNIDISFFPAGVYLIELFNKTGYKVFAQLILKE